MIRGAKKHHPLGFKQHPLEDVGISSYIIYKCIHSAWVNCGRFVDLTPTQKLLHLILYGLGRHVH